MPKTTYRQATENDAEDIAAIAGLVIEEAGASSGLRGSMTPEQAAKRMGGYKGRGAMFVCRMDGEAVAFAALEPLDDEPDAAVMGAWVLADQRGQGIGTDLALMALGFARSKGYNKVRGTIPAGNEAALSFSSIGALVPRVAGPDMRYELPL
jgi:predicted N-acetyltransferase YhbS